MRQLSAPDFVTLLVGAFVYPNLSKHLVAIHFFRRSTIVFVFDILHAIHIKFQGIDDVG